MTEVAILDFGSQYTQLIARTIRSLGVFSTIRPYDATLNELQKSKVSAVILSGGPASVWNENAPKCDPELLEGKIPLLGICYGMQMLAHSLGGKVSPSSNREYGKTKIKLVEDSLLFSAVPKEFSVWMSHGDIVEKAPPGWKLLAFSANDHNRVCVGIENSSLKIVGLQFHPEVTHTEFGKQIISNFLFRICGLAPTWTPGEFIEESISSIRNVVGEEKVVLGVSGGVDSTVATLLFHKAIGDRLIPVFIDNGLLRRNERQEVETNFNKEFGIKLRVCDASARFLSKLEAISDPEAKRRIIGNTFVETFTEVVKGIGKNVKFLGQGTLYPDVIESKSPNRGPSATIKTHHNVGGLPEELGFELIEPLRWLFKDDVRRVGKELRIKEGLLKRHPFPGPGLAVRIIGAISRERLEILKLADSIFIDELRNADWYDKVSQALAVLLPVRSVGVMGDFRTYEETIALRAVVTQDFMTADWAKLPPELLEKISNRIINEVKGVNRVVYDISSKPPATIEWE